jgi:serine/threonine-protein kinase
MLTGRRAFTGDSAVETMNAILTATPPPMSVAATAPPEALEDVVRRCLEKDPERRFASARGLVAALDATHGCTPTIPARGYRAPAAEGIPRPPATGRVVLAVLPFENLSRDEEQEYISDGLTEEMIAQSGSA